MPPGRLLPPPFNTGVIHGYGEENDSERLGTGTKYEDGEIVWGGVDIKYWENCATEGTRGIKSHEKFSTGKYYLKSESGFALCLYRELTCAKIHGGLMRICHIRLQNYRACENISIEMNSSTMLIGGNGVGKSTILLSLVHFFDPAHTIREEDFSYGYNSSKDDDPHPIEIEVAFSGLTDDEQKEFSSYIHNNQLAVVKVYDQPGLKGNYYGTQSGIPQFKDIRSTPGKTEKKNLFNAVVKQDVLPGLSQVSSAPKADAAMDEYEAAHPELCIARIRKNEQFFGPRNVGGGKLDKFTSFVYIPAVKDVQEETCGKNGSAVDQLVKRIVSQKIDRRKDIQQARDKILNIVEENFSPANLPELNSVATAHRLVFKPKSPPL